MFVTGQGISQSNMNAFEWFSTAAAQGCASAQTNLGSMYYQGLGIIQCYEKAFEADELSERRNELTSGK